MRVGGRREGWAQGCGQETAEARTSPPLCVLTFFSPPPIPWGKGKGEKSVCTGV